MHITDYQGDDTNEVITRAKDVVTNAGLEDEPEVAINFRMSDPRYANRVGKDILQLVEERGYDHVIMGHHGTGRIGRAILGSAAKTVVQAAEVPSTIIP